MKISIKRGDFEHRFDGDEYIVDLSRQMEPYQQGDLICYTAPWSSSGVPLVLDIAIRADGTIAFRSWAFGKRGNAYLHTDEIGRPDEKKPWEIPFVPTAEQIDTVNGLFSGRITFEGLKLTPGATLQKVCPIDVQREEKLVGHTIYLA